MHARRLSMHARRLSKHARRLSMHARRCARTRGGERRSLRSHPRWREKVFSHDDLNAGLLTVASTDIANRSMIVTTVTILAGSNTKCEHVHSIATRCRDLRLGTNKQVATASTNAQPRRTEPVRDDDATITYDTKQQRTPLRHPACAPEAKCSRLRISHDTYVQTTRTDNRGCDFLRMHRSLSNVIQPPFAFERQYCTV